MGGQGNIKKEKQREKPLRADQSASIKKRLRSNNKNYITNATIVYLDCKVLLYIKSSFRRTTKSGCEL